MTLIVMFLAGMSLGLLLGKVVFSPLSTVKMGGSIIVQETDNGGKLYTLELDGDPENLDTMDEVTFRISS